LKIGSKRNLKITYCFCDGLLNILQSGKKDQQQRTKAFITTKDPVLVKEYFEILLNFLYSHANYGVYSGIVGAQLNDIMKLDLAVQLSSYLLAL
jgi:hypothetical protein